MGMDEPRFARKSAPSRANHTWGADLSTHAAGAPASDDEIDEIKSAVLAKLALDLGKDASVATDRDWFVAAALTIRDRIVHRLLQPRPGPQARLLSVAGVSHRATFRRRALQHGFDRDLSGGDRRSRCRSKPAARR